MKLLEKTVVKEGQKAPAFNLPDQDGVKRSPGDWAGSKIVIFFYPKANTGG